MNFLKLQYFMDTVECGSITKAAEKNYIAQPAVSQQIHDLERELGYRLFDRFSRNIVLTDAGKSFYRYSCIMMKSYKEMKRAICDIESGKTEGR